MRLWGHAVRRQLIVDSPHVGVKPYTVLTPLPQAFMVLP